MFWKHIASSILKNRLIIFICVLALSAFMGYEASKVKITFNGGKVLPVTDSAFIRYSEFKKTFGQDASLIVTLPQSNVEAFAARVTDMTAGRVEIIHF